MSELDRYNYIVVLYSADVNVATFGGAYWNLAEASRRCEQYDGNHVWTSIYKRRNSGIDEWEYVLKQKGKKCASYLSYTPMQYFHMRNGRYTQMYFTSHPEY